MRINKDMDKGGGSLIPVLLTISVKGVIVLAKCQYDLSVFSRNMLLAARSNLRCETLKIAFICGG